MSRRRDRDRMMFLVLVAGLASAAVSWWARRERERDQKRVLDQREIDRWLRPR